MGKKRKGYNTKGKDYRKNRIEKLAAKSKERLKEYSAAYDKGKLGELIQRKSSQFKLNKWRHRLNQFVSKHLGPEYKFRHLKKNKELLEKIDLKMVEVGGGING